MPMSDIKVRNLIAKGTAYIFQAFEAIVLFDKRSLDECGLSL